jgi:hypothetical protein
MVSLIGLSLKKDSLEIFHPIAAEGKTPNLELSPKAE